MQQPFYIYTFCNIIADGTLPVLYILHILVYHAVYLVSIQALYPTRVRLLCPMMGQHHATLQCQRLNRLYFNSAHQNFLDRLKTRFPDITTGDLRVCCLLKMNLSTKEIASLMNVSVRAIELRRYRLRKRFELDNETNLVDFLMKFQKSTCTFHISNTLFKI